MSCIKSELITDDFIYNLELFHDNKNIIELIQTQKYFYDTMNEKKVNVIKEIKEPEQIIKNLIFKDISYQKICFKNESLSNNIIKIGEQDFILIFDNMQLKKKKYRLVCDIILKKNCPIYIPFIYLAELSIGKLIDIDKIITNLKIKYESNIFVVNYKTINNKIKIKYKLLSEKIGLCFFGNKIRLINYQIFEKKLTEENKSKIIKELKLLNYYFSSIDKQGSFFINILSEAYNQFINTFYTNDILDENKLNLMTNATYENIITIRALIVSFKEARDTCYISEINDLAIKNFNFNMLYITTDEISCMRCILNKISTLNIFGDNIRYLCYVEKNNENYKLYLKLYNILHLLNNEGLPEITNKYIDNSDLILKESKSLISKIIYNFKGGFNTTEIKFTELKPKKDLDYLKSYLSNFPNITNVFFMEFMNDLFKSVELFAIQDKEHLKKREQIYEIINTLEILDNQYTLDDYCNIDIEQNSPIYYRFHRKMVCMKENKDDHEKFIGRKVINKNILVCWFISEFIIFNYITIQVLNYIEKYFLPGIFDKYNLYDTYMWMNHKSVVYKFEKYIEHSIEYYQINLHDEEDEKELYTFNYDQHIKNIFCEDY